MITTTADLTQSVLYSDVLNDEFIMGITQGAEEIYLVEAPIPGLM